MRRMDEITSMRGQTVLLTGATSGIGKETARALAKAGATLVLGARDRALANALQVELKNATGNSQISVLLGDLSSLASVRAMAAQFLKKHQRLHVLINNAGLVMSKRELTEDGLERSFATNHLGPFLLTMLLLDTLKASAPARIINVASAAHTRGRMHWDDLQFSEGFSGLRSYSQSKLCNVLFTNALSRQLAGTAVTVNALHPGVVRSGFASNTSGWLHWGWRLLRPFMIDSAKGSRTTVHLASSPVVDGVTGKYFAREREKLPSRAARSEQDADRLFAESLRLVGSLAAAKTEITQDPTASGGSKRGRR